MKRKISEIDYGTDVWMYLPHYSEVHPILVTIESDSSDDKFLMPRKRYSLKNESDVLEGFEGLCQYLNGGCNIVFATQDCWDNEQECQEYIDAILEKKRKEDEWLKNKYRELAKEYCHIFHWNLEGENHFHYIQGFIDCAMYMRENRHKLDIKPENENLSESK